MPGCLSLATVVVVSFLRARWQAGVCSRRYHTQNNHISLPLRESRKLRLAHTCDGCPANMFVGAERVFSRRGSGVDADDTPAPVSVLVSPVAAVAVPPSSMSAFRNPSGVRGALFWGLQSPGRGEHSLLLRPDSCCDSGCFVPTLASPCSCISARVASTSSCVSAPPGKRLRLEGRRCGLHAS